ncbi:MAG TPA: hypothetical protein VFU59_00090 [Candidatus Eisenbacteria bacterium]|nr:hypothetical protein [Candidatus Eisenbacteria bacterium]
MKKAAAAPSPGQPLVLLGLALAAILLAIHVRAYFFLTDDAFISFRYAQNLSQGHGLVFNPGGERVEGYTNLLWVLILAGFDALGLAPERVANVLSVAATAALVALVVRFVWTRAPRGQAWVALLPALFLASTRSFAVWASSGLETRLFELLLVAGLFRLVEAMEAHEESGPPRLGAAPWLFGLAALTRPDGALIGGCVMLAAAGYRGWTARRAPWGDLAAWWPLLALVGANTAFRLAYYGEWLPNTYYAKVGGHFAWARGARYLAAFALEYGALLWLPAIAVAIGWFAKRKALLVPILIAAAIVPHALYVAAIGGDHFEYRPLDVYLPLLFVLVAVGAGAWATTRARAWGAAAYAALIVVGLVWLPLRSHREFPPSYLPGFPGAFAKTLPEGEQFLSPDRDPLFRLPILRGVAVAHRDLIRSLTTELAGVRQEEHRLFFEKVSDEAEKLEALLASGVLPRDLYVALSCVGVVPYRTGLRTLDRLGLTDAHVARSALVSDMVAHGKVATIGYARERGVDLWSAEPVLLVCPAGTNRLEDAIRRGQAESSEFYAADLGSGDFLFVQLPQGLEQARRRLPRVALKPVGDPAIARAYVRAFLPEFEGYVRQGRVTPGRVQRLGEIAVLAGDLESAARVYDAGIGAWPTNWQFHWMLAIARKQSGDDARATAALREAMSLLQAAGDAAGAARLAGMFEQLRRTP